MFPCLSISLDDMPSVPAVAAGPGSPVSVLHNSPFYPPVTSPAPLSSPAPLRSPAPLTSPAPAFTTFQPVHMRTSPEGSSGSDQETEQRPGGARTRDT